ncbi:MAG: UDP-N-acetylmuramoyl-tripeptide--D-alanyl-D-alanine ligase [Thermodesulfovibrionales bacterium]|nr:UDP-N-acetylmuramoyl-tripeptide--D-alanyl-D-alanine ligase [Thermodesulfovibrionales bacterium]
MKNYLNIKDVIIAVNGISMNVDEGQFTGVSIDSRTIKEGELFIALKGDNFDGHDFVIESLKKGKGAVVRKEWFNLYKDSIPNKTIIGVDDTLKALHDLAGFIRKQFYGPVVAVVGSNGKTTTKELIYSILERKWEVLKTSGNFNNHVGMPLSICHLTSNHQVMLLEMGANKPNDIEELCKIANPEIGVVTNIGFEHLEGFGSIQKVRESELEILPYLKTVIANRDDDFLMEGVEEKLNGKLITFGVTSEKADIRAKNIKFFEGYTDFSLIVKDLSIEIKTKLSGIFNVYNCLASAATASVLGVRLEEIKQGLESFSGVKYRFELKRYKGVTFINDVYNANPSSMELSIRELARLYNLKKEKFNRAIAVLGDMFELGEYSKLAHNEIGLKLSESKIDFFIAVGERMKDAIKSFKGESIHVPDSSKAAEELSHIIKEGDLVLIKGSRGMKMEKVLEYIERHF